MLTAFQIGPFPLLSTFFLFLSEPEFRPGLLSATAEKEKKVGKHGQSVLQMKDIKA